ncbi:hypothetical protein BDD12DRAFT_838821 [Trichophaea hybrida]|nr:hypothetical protein BDD12DRAFT_838821 [Trichophaea hybrida]
MCNHEAMKAQRTSLQKIRRTVLNSANCPSCLVEMPYPRGKWEADLLTTSTVNNET